MRIFKRARDFITATTLFTLVTFSSTNVKAQEGVGGFFSGALRDHENYQRMIARGIDRRSAHLEDLETLQETSIDFYAAMRELYRQHRANEIRAGELPSLLPIPRVTQEEFSEDEFDQASAKGEMEEQ